MAAEKHIIHACPRFSPLPLQFKIWLLELEHNFREMSPNCSPKSISEREENFLSKSCTCRVLQAKTIKWKAFTKGYLLVIPVTFAQFLSASKRDLMIDIQRSNNTKKIDILGRFVTSVSDEEKIVLRGSWRMTMNSVNKWQALSNLLSSGTRPNSLGIGAHRRPSRRPRTRALI